MGPIISDIQERNLRVYTVEQLGRVRTEVHRPRPRHDDTVVAAYLYRFAGEGQTRRMHDAITHMAEDGIYSPASEPRHPVRRGEYLRLTNGDDAVAHGEDEGL